MPRRCEQSWTHTHSLTDGCDEETWRKGKQRTKCSTPWGLGYTPDMLLSCTMRGKHEVIAYATAHSRLQRNEHIDSHDLTAMRHIAHNGGLPYLLPGSQNA